MNMLLSILLAVTMMSDSVLFEAYGREDMEVWKELVASDVSGDAPIASSVQFSTLLYEYGYCGYIVAEAKKEGREALLPEAVGQVQQFRRHVEASKGQLPPGHYEMYMSAVYVYELRLHESIHPVKSMNIAKEATRLAPGDPLVVSYYGTCLFYAPKPFGNKQEALQWFEKAKELFVGDEWQYCWVRQANEMYIQQCHEKLKKH